MPSGSREEKAVEILHTKGNTPGVPKNLNGCQNGDFHLNKVISAPKKYSVAYFEKSGEIPSGIAKERSKAYGKTEYNNIPGQNQQILITTNPPLRLS